MASLMEAAGNVMDLPASMIRDVLMLRNPVDQLLSPLGQDDRTSGQEILNAIGLEGEHPWLGMGLEMALDPTTYFGWGALSKGAKGYKALSKGLKTAGKKGGVRGVASHLLGREARERLASLQSARADRVAALRDIPLTPLQEAQAATATATATQASSFDEGLAIINALPDGPAKQKALADFAELSGYERQAESIGRGVLPPLPPPQDARTALADAIVGPNPNVPPNVRAAIQNATEGVPAWWIGDPIANKVLNNEQDWQMLNALTEASTGLPYDIPARIQKQPAGPDFFMDSLRAMNQNIGARDPFADAFRMVPETPATTLPSRVTPAASAAPSSIPAQASSRPYQAYSLDELAGMDDEFIKDMQFQSQLTDGDSSRARVARGQVKQLERQRAAIAEELAMRSPQPPVAPVVPAASAAPAASTASRLGDAASLMSQVLVSPAMVDFDDLARLAGQRTDDIIARAPPPAPAPARAGSMYGDVAAGEESLAAARRAFGGYSSPMPLLPQPPQLTDLERRFNRINFGGRDLEARDAYNAAVSAAPAKRRKVLGRRMPTLESLRNATYRDPNFRNFFGGGGAMLAVSEGRAGNPYDPLAEEQMLDEEDPVMRAMLSYQGQ